jgi:hypothetical protein
MRKFILFAFAFCCIGFASAFASDKHNAESQLITDQGCLVIHDADYTLEDDTGHTVTLIGSVTKLRHYVNRRVEIVGEATVETLSTTQDTLASSVVEMPAIRVRSGKLIGGRCR